MVQTNWDELQQETTGDRDEFARPAPQKPQPQEISANIQDLIRGILNDAIGMHASDVHIEPTDNACQVRMRIDGRLKKHTTLTPAEYELVINAVKVLADLDVAIHTIPQDGHFELFADQVGSDTQQNAPSNEIQSSNRAYFDVRVSVYPTVNGEVVVFRILGRASALLSLDEIGMDIESLQKIRAVLAGKGGMVLLSGPTGSGKTTTLYSILQELRSDELNIVTLEDPVEFLLDWLRQSEVHEERGFSYEQALASILRQDPDVLMVGEIRDPKTAEYAVRTALVGRMVGSTIHAHSNVGTFARLVEMGIPKSLLGHAVNAVVSQRLVLRLCDRCKSPYEPSHTLLARLGLGEHPGPYYRGEGCPECDGLGYNGRVPVYSVLVMSDHLRHMVFDDRTLEEIERAAVEEGMRTLRQGAVTRVLAGETTVEEAMRVV